MSKPEYKAEVFTGIRPTGDLTIANYIGAVKPILKLQEQGIKPVVFVADLHAITDKEPALAKKFTHEVVSDYIALGLDPKQTTIYVQSVIKEQLFTLMSYLSRLITVAELLRVPTLKDKIKGNPETANSFLLLYPVLMAADILMFRSEKVPVGKDQVAHIEVTRDLAKAFNKKYAPVFLLPKVMQVEAIKILSLKGEGKMSKSVPEGAIFLTDSIADVKRKVKRAMTATEKQMTPALQSNILLVKGLATDQNDKDQLDQIIQDHMKGQQVMGQFKKVMEKVLVEFMENFQKRKAKIKKSEIEAILEKGNKYAQQVASETMEQVEKSMFK